MWSKNMQTKKKWTNEMSKKMQTKKKWINKMWTKKITD